MKRWLWVFLSCVLLTACSDGENFAPVTEVGASEAIPASGQYRVTNGETLYSIAWRYGMDYRYLAEINHIAPPYQIQSGQIIYLRGKAATSLVTQAKPMEVETPVAIPVKPLTVLKPIETASSQASALVQFEREPNVSTNGWVWPAKGKVISNFSSSHKGVNIAGELGEPIYATASGKVVYAGNKLRGYGNLIIMKHNNLYLSAYAHNRIILVKEGDWVQKGQKIAEMGKTGTDKVMLHFEIRKGGKPIDPYIMYNQKQLSSFDIIRYFG